MFAAAYDRMYSMTGVAALYRTSQASAWEDVTVRFKHAGRDAEGTRAIIKVRVGEVGGRAAHGGAVRGGRARVDRGGAGGRGDQGRVAMGVRGMVCPRRQWRR